MFKLPKGLVKLKAFNKEDVNNAMLNVDGYLDALAGGTVADGVRSAFSGEDKPISTTTISLKPFVGDIRSVVNARNGEKSDVNVIGKLRIPTKHPAHSEKLDAIMKFIKTSSLTFDPSGLNTGMVEAHSKFGQQLTVAGDNSFRMVGVPEEMVEDGKVYLIKIIKTSKILKSLEANLKVASSIDVTIYRINIDGGSEILTTFKIIEQKWLRELIPFQNAYYERSTRYPKEPEFIFVENFDLCQLYACCVMIFNTTCPKQLETVFDSTFKSLEYSDTVKTICKDCGKAIHYLRNQNQDAFEGLNFDPDFESNPEAKSTNMNRLRNLFNDYGIITLDDKSIRMDDWFMINWMSGDLFKISSKLKGIFTDDVLFNEFLVTLNYELIATIISESKFGCMSNYITATKF